MGSTFVKYRSNAGVGYVVKCDSEYRERVFNVLFDNNLRLSKADGEEWDDADFRIEVSTDSQLNDFIKGIENE